MGMHRRSTRSKTGCCGVGSRILLSLVLAVGMTTLSLAAPQGAGGLRPLFAEDATSLGADATAVSTDAVVANGGNVQTASETAGTGSGPVRMARFYIIEGKVSWRASTDGDWSTGAINLPLRQGAQVWTDEHSRTEIEFDDGSRLRMDSNTLLTLQTLYSDTQGEFTEITVNDGRVFLRLQTQYSVYQVDTPLGSVKAAGPARFRVGVGETLQVAVRQGVVTVEGSKQQVKMHDGDYLELRSEDSSYALTPLPKDDSFDSWNEARDRAVDGLSKQPGYQNLPSDIAICADDLSSYGTWRDDPVFGPVWVPRVDSHWRPYFHGRWVLCEPYGWTWVSAEPWGWAPYHYGTWVHPSYGWAWCPGPVDQYWSPACVSFCDYGGDVCWCPLAPWEVVYPGFFDCGFGFGDWSLCFSIGGCGVFYPGWGGAFGCRPWNSAWLNHGDFGGFHGNFGHGNLGHGNFGQGNFGQGNFGGSQNHNGLLAGGNFVPGNARWGASSASAGAFAGLGGSYHALNRQDSARFFDHGNVVGAPEAGRPFAGPQSVHPTAASGTIHGAFDAKEAPQSAMNRSVFRAPLPQNVKTGEALAAQNTGSRTESAGSPGLMSGNRQPATSGGVAGRFGANRETSGTNSFASGNSSHGLENYLSDRTHGTWSTRSGSEGGFDSERPGGGYSHGAGGYSSGGHSEDRGGGSWSGGRNSGGGGWSGSHAGGGGGWSGGHSGGGGGWGGGHSGGGGSFGGGHGGGGGGGRR